jgi:hypothetical protein
MRCCEQRFSSAVINVAPTLDFQMIRFSRCLSFAGGISVTLLEDGVKARGVNLPGEWIPE